MFGLSERFGKPPPIYEPGPGAYDLKPTFGKDTPKDLTQQLVEKIYRGSPGGRSYDGSVSASGKASPVSEHIDELLAERVTQMEANLNNNRTPHCAPNRKRGGAPAAGVLHEGLHHMSNSVMNGEIATGADRTLARHSWLAGEISGDAYVFKSLSTGENVGPGSYASEDSTAPEKPASYKSHNYLVKKSQEVAKHRSGRWEDRRNLTRSQWSSASQWSGSPQAMMQQTSMMVMNNPSLGGAGGVSSSSSGGGQVVFSPQQQQQQQLSQQQQQFHAGGSSSSGNELIDQSQPQVYINSMREPQTLQGQAQHEAQHQQQRASPMQAPSNGGGGAYGVLGKNNIVVQSPGLTNGGDPMMNNLNNSDLKFQQQAMHQYGDQGNGFTDQQRMTGHVVGVTNGGSAEYFNPHYPASFYGQ